MQDTSAGLESAPKSALVYTEVAEGNSYVTALTDPGLAQKA